MAKSLTVADAVSNARTSFGLDDWTSPDDMMYYGGTVAESPVAYQSVNPHAGFEAPNPYAMSQDTMMSPDDMMTMGSSVDYGNWSPPVQQPSYQSVNPHAGFNPYVMQPDALSSPDDMMAMGYDGVGRGPSFNPGSSNFGEIMNQMSVNPHEGFKPVINTGGGVNEAGLFSGLGDAATKALGFLNVGEAARYNERYPYGGPRNDSAPPSLVDIIPNAGEAARYEERYPDGGGARNLDGVETRMSTYLGEIAKSQDAPDNLKVRSLLDRQEESLRSRIEERDAINGLLAGLDAQSQDVAGGAAVTEAAENAWKQKDLKDDIVELENGKIDWSEEAIKSRNLGFKMDRASAAAGGADARELGQIEKAKTLAQGYKERYGLSDEAAKFQENYMSDLEKIYKRQKIAMVLGAIAGDSNVMKLAQASAGADIQLLQMKYGMAKDKNGNPLYGQHNQRMQEMTEKFFFNENGEYDPPANMKDANRALQAMGATMEEREFLLGKMAGPEIKTADVKNFEDINGNKYMMTVQEAYDLSKKNPELGLIISGAGRSSDTSGGTAGEQLEIITDLRSRLGKLKEGTKEYESVKQKLLDAERLFDLTEKPSGWDSNDTALVKLYLDEFTLKQTGKVDWDKVNEKYGAVTGWKKVKNMDEFLQVYNDVIKPKVSGTNNQRSQAPISSGTPPISSEPTASNPPVVTSQAQYDALPSGTIYIDSQGQKRKP